MADDHAPIGGGIKTYAEILGGKRKHISQRSTTFEEVVADGKSELVAIREATVYGTEPFIRVSPEEINKLSGWFNLALIGKFSQGKPSFNTIREGHHVGKCYWKSTSGINANNGTPSKKNKTENESKSVKNETTSTTKSNIPPKGVSQLASSKTVSTPPPIGPSEEEIWAFVLQKTLVTTQDLVAEFRSRLSSKENKDAFAHMLRRIVKLQKTKEANYIDLRER